MQPWRTAFVRETSSSASVAAILTVAVSACQRRWLLAQTGASALVEGTNRTM
jgi:hypothetical protein